MKIRLIGILFTLFLIQFGRVYAQGPKLIHYTVNEGLASSNIYCAYQDSEGYIWFGTDKGVSRFDGKNSVNYTISDGLSDDEIFRIYEDSKQRLWFLTANGKLSYFFKNKFHTSSNDSILKQMVSSGFLWNFHEDSKHNLWITGSKNNIFKLSSDNKVNVYHLKHEKPYSIWETKTNDIILLTNCRLLYLDKTKAFVPLIDYGTPLIGSLGFYDAKNNIVYSSDRNQLIQFDLKSKSFKKMNVLLGKIIFIGEADSDHIWVGTYKGVYLISKKGIIKLHLLKDNNVTGVLIDHEKNTWFTTQDQGVFLAPNIDIITYGSAEGFKRINKVLYYNNSIYTYGDHLYCNKITPNKIEQTRLLSLKAETRGRITSVTRFNANGLFIGADEGLFLVDSQKHQHFNNLGAVKSVYINSDSVLYLSLHNRTFKFPKQVSTDFAYLKQLPFENIDEYLLVNNVTWCFYKDKNHLWAGTDDGPIIINDSAIVSISKRFSKLKQRVLGITSTSDSVVWFSCGNAGVKVMCNNKLQTVEQTKNIFCSHIIAGNKTNEVWLATNKGVLNIQRVDTGFRIEHYGLQHGINDYEINYLLLRNDTLWIATNDGITVFPVHISKFKFSPYLHLKSVSVNNAATLLASINNLAYNQNNIVLSYDGISFKDRGDITYTYKLIGTKFEGTTKDNKIILEDLKPGSYTLSVCAINSLGYKSNTLQLPFIIHLPWWSTWWFKTLLGIVFAGLVFLFFKVRILTYNRDIVRELLLMLFSYFRKENFIVVRSLKDGSNVKIIVKDILWIESSREYVKIVTKENEVLARKSMIEMEKQLSHVPGIVRIHKSYIVNINYASGLKWNQVLINGVTLPIGRSFKSKIDHYQEHFKAKSSS